MPSKDTVTPSLRNPFELDGENRSPDKAPTAAGPYDVALEEGVQLRERPRTAAGPVATGKQHAKRRMTVWERMDVVRDSGTEPTILYQNWGPNLDGASLVTAVVQIEGREVALYGHDFTVRAGSMDATNGTKLANLIRLAGRQGMPLIGMNDSAGAFVPAGHRRPRRLRGGVHRAPQDQRCSAEHHVHVRLQRWRRLVFASAGQLHDPAIQHLLRPDRSRRGEVGAGRGRDRRRAWRPWRPWAERRRRPYRP